MIDRGVSAMQYTSAPLEPMPADPGSSAPPPQGPGVAQIYAEERRQAIRIALNIIESVSRALYVPEPAHRKLARRLRLM